MDGRLALHILLCGSVAVFFVVPSAKGRSQADDCTSGFISLNRMNKVLDNYLVNSPNDRQAIIPEINFTCNGNIRTWIFGAQWTDGPTLTELQIWRNENGYYNRINSTAINVTRSNSTLLYWYPLPTSLSFQAGDVLGFYQPPSSERQLRLWLAERTEPLQTVYFRTGNPDTQFVSGFNRTQNVLVSVETDHPECGSGFMSLETMYTLVGLGEVGRLVNSHKRQQITPNITFTCNGWITKWIIGAIWDENDALFPELQVWRSNGGDIYKKINGTFIRVETVNTSLIYEYSDFSPIPFQEGDILGAFVPRGGLSKLKLRSEGNRGPLNYYMPTNNDANESPYDTIDSSGTLVRRATYHPLVSVEISVSTSSVQEKLTSTISSSLDMAVIRTSSEFQTSSIDQTLLATTSTDIEPFTTATTSKPNIQVSSPVLPDVSTDSGSQLFPTSVPTPPDVSTDSGSQSSVGVGVGGGVGAAVVLLVVVGVLGVGLFCVWRRRHTSKVVLSPPAGVSNPVYEREAVSGNGLHYNKSAQLQEGVYDSPYTEYELVGSRPSCNETHAFENPLYSDVGPVTSTESNIYETTEYGASATSGEYTYVPTNVQRDKLSYLKDGAERNQEFEVSSEYAYAKTRISEYLNRDRGHPPDRYIDLSIHQVANSHGSLQEYFKECDIYWAPASTVNGIYEQLSHYKYREISRQHIQVTGELGSGEFGDVSRGRWQDAVGESVDVAIKTLKPSAKEKDRVKFLQEAAINGQFRHPNIVQLHGVVTVGEPVMIVMEYMSNGDLRNFLHSLKAKCDPSQQSDLPQLCLRFCRQIASGMSYLAGKAFVHRDLAARNILVSENRVCKVADFGMTRDLDEAAYYVSHGGQIPVKWTAPEALQYKKYSTASDVWSFGCLMFEIWSLGHKPFEGYTNQQALRLVSDGRRLAPPPGCPRAIYSVMISCWHPEKSSRPSFSSLCQTLNGESASLLQWREEDSQCHPQASLLGAELAAGKDLYTELQDTYLQK